MDLGDVLGLVHSEHSFRLFASPSLVSDGALTIAGLRGLPLGLGGKEHYGPQPSLGGDLRRRCKGTGLPQGG